MDIIPPLLLQLVLISLNAIFASAEIAIISISEAKANKLASDGKKGAKGLLKLVAHPAKLLATIQIAITLSGFLGSAFAAEHFADKLTPILLKCGIATTSTEDMWSTICVILVTLILSYFTLIFGELVPKQLAMHKSEKIALTLSRPLLWTARVFTPAVWFLTASTNLVLRLFGIDPNESTEEVKEEDILMMVDTSDDIQTEEKQMIQNVFEFNDITVNEFATHRTDMTVLWDEDDIAVWDETIRHTFHKHYPVCHETTDNIIGILSIKDYFQLDTPNRDVVMQQCLSQPLFVPETIKADMLFRRMKAAHKCFAVVLDEYGGVHGIVTFDDILEQIVGDFNEDAPRDTHPNISHIQDNQWRISGVAPLDEVNEVLGTTFNVNEYETFGGLVFGAHGLIPSDDTEFSIDIDNVSVDVKAIQDHVITEAVVTVYANPTNESKQTSE